MPETVGLLAVLIAVALYIHVLSWIVFATFFHCKRRHFHEVMKSVDNKEE